MHFWLRAGTRCVRRPVIGQELCFQFFMDAALKQASVVPCCRRRSSQKFVLDSNLGLSLGLGNAVGFGCTLGLFGQRVWQVKQRLFGTMIAHA